MAETNGNGKVKATGQVIQTILLALALLFLFLDRIVMPGIGTGELAKKVQAHSEDIATLKEGQRNVLYLLEKIDRDLTAHRASGK